MVKNLLALMFVCFAFSGNTQTSTSGCTWSGAMSNGKTAGCGNSPNPCDLASLYSAFGTFCGTTVVSGSGSQVTASTQIVLPAACSATIFAEMKQRTSVHATGCNNSGPDGNDYVAITATGGLVASEGGTLCCSGGACSTYPSLPGTPVVIASASGFSTGCSNGAMTVEMVVTGGTVTITGRSDRADEITTYTIGFEGSCGPSCSAVLPVTLASFYGMPETDAIRLHWNVSREVNVYRYVVERSDDGMHFQPLITLPSIAGEAGPFNLRYSASDPSPVKGINYYRLTTQDHDGSASVSAPIAVLWEEGPGQGLALNYEGNSIKAFMSPGTNWLYIYDLSGCEIVRLNVNGQLVAEINRDALPAGIYFIATDKSSGWKKALVY